MKKRRMRQSAAFLCAVLLFFAAAARDVTVLADTAEEEQVTEEACAFEAEEVPDETGSEVPEETKEEAEAPNDTDGETEAEAIVPDETVNETEAEEVPDEEEDSETVVLEESSAEEVLLKEDTVTEEVEEPLFSCIAEDSVLSEAALLDLDFSSKRLLIAGEILPEDTVNELSVYDGVHLMQYSDAATARNAYSYYYGKAAFVFIDSVISVAGGDGGAVSSGVMTENSNPLDELASEVSKGAGAYTVALIDTGADGYVEKAVSMIGDDVSDANGHGTKMASLIKEQNPGAAILSIKALGANGTGDASAVYAAVKYAIEANVSIINLSISTVKKTENAVVAKAIAEALANGIIVVAAAGNNGSDASCFTPGGVSGVITVGACDENGVKLPISNGGAAVDYYAIGGSTSEAAARYSGYLSAGKSGIDNVLVFDGNGKPEKEPDKEYGLYVLNYTVTNGQFAAADTKTISFITSPISYDGCGMGDGSNYSDQAFIIQSGGAPGFTQGYCVEPSKHQPATGTYTTNVTAVTNEAVLKVLYYGYGGPGDITEPYGNRFTPVNAAFTREQARHGLTHVAAARATNEQGYTNDGNIYRGLSSAAITAVNDLYNDIMSRPTPKGMTVYMATPSAGEQTMIFVGEYNPVSYAKLQKNMSDGTPLSGAVFGIYRTEADARNAIETGSAASAVATVTSGADGSSETVEIPGNVPLWAVEIAFPAGVKKQQTVVWTGGVSPGETWTIEAQNEPAGGFLKVQKTSAAPEITNGNSCYILSGIQFKVYRDRACTREVTADIDGSAFTLTTGEGGETGTVRLDEGTYYVREEESSLLGKGWDYNSTPAAVQVSAAANDTEAKAAIGTVSNQPLLDPVGVLLKKVDENGEESDSRLFM